MFSADLDMAQRNVRDMLEQEIKLADVSTVGPAYKKVVGTRF